MRISQKTLQDALGVCGSIYRMNAQSAIGYAFCVNSDNTEVSSGEFIFNGENPHDMDYDGFIDFANKTLHDFIGKKIIKLS